MKKIYIVVALFSLCLLSACKDDDKPGYLVESKPMIGVAPDASSMLD